MSSIAELKAQLGKLDDLIASGVLKGEEARQAREQLEAQILDAVREGKGQGHEDGHESGMGDDTGAGARPSKALLGGLLAFVLVFGAAGYAWRGNFPGWAVSPGSPAAPDAQAAGDDAGHAMTRAKFEALTQKLAERLKKEPQDTDGWTMLGRSYAMLGRDQEAKDAFKRTLDLRPKDAQALADYADALGTANGRKLVGEPERLIAEALRIDPANVKALGLSGTLAFERGDAATAARQWEQALRKLDPASSMAQQLQSALDEARQRAGMPRLAIAAAATAATTTTETGADKPAPNPPAAAAVAANPNAAVKVRVSLAPALADKAAPDDTVFIFARAVQGPRAPLAIERRKVKDLPVEITLDDSTVMNPALRLSGVAEVVVGARVSKSGNAMPQAGDLQGLSAKVAVGTKDLKLSIDQVLP